MPKMGKLRSKLSFITAKRFVYLTSTIFRTTQKVKVTCKNCLPKDGIEIPDFTQSAKNNIVALTIQSPIQSIKFIVENFNLSPQDAKYIVTHINIPYGHCNRCTFHKLDEEYINCPTCGALNLNWQIDDESSI